MLQILFLYLNFVASDVDFGSKNEQVVFAIGEFSKDITIGILPNPEREDDEMFYVYLNTDCCAEVTTGFVQVNITESTPDGKQNL